MGAFDDLILAKQTANGSFDDLVPKQSKSLGAPEPLTKFEDLLSRISIPKPIEYALSRARGFAMGAADPVVGAVQLAANALPNSSGIPQKINQAIADKEREYQQQRSDVGSEGFDVMRMGGNVASPANLVIASKVPMAASKGKRVAQGIGFGGAGAATTPIADTDNGFWAQKGAQTAIGAATGGITTPVLNKLGEAVARRVQSSNQAVTAERTVSETNRIISEALKEVGQTINDLPPAQVDNLRKQVTDALQGGKKLDAAAALRKADFDALGIPPTLGQITRDPNQFAKERNLRSVANVGEPLLQRFDQQNRALQERIGGLSEGAQEAFQAGEQLSSSLRAADQSLSGKVSNLYEQARQSAGKDLDVPLQGLAQDYARVIDNFGDKVPSGVRNQFKALGLENGVQQKVFTIGEADKLLKVINANVGNDPATNRALSELRNAVKNSVMTIDASGGPFAPAVKAAAQRFKLHEAVPALEAAANGSVAPDDFVKKFIVSGKTNDVKGLAKLLGPDALKQARAQLGAHLQRAAFGENTTGDKAFSQERFNKALREIGTAKLAAFFSPEEIFTIQRAGRVGAYMNSIPSAAPVNTSNTAGALLSLAGRIPGVPAVVSGVNAVRNAVDNTATVNRAVAAAPPVTLADLLPEQRARLAMLLTGGALGTGALVASPFRDRE